MTDASLQGKRIDEVDILRAVGIIIMVMGHVGFGGKFDRFIHTFHMPLFFLISGYLYRQKKEVSFGKYLCSKARRLLIPYITYACINYVFWLIFAMTAENLWWEPLLRLVTYNTEGLPICGALWFLTSMFFAEVLYFVLDRLFKKEAVRAAVVLLIAGGASYAENVTGYRLPLSLDTSVVCMGFLEIGRLFKEFLKRKQVIVKKSFAILLSGTVFLIINVVLAFVNDYVNIKSGWYGCVPLFWINAVIGTFAFVLFVIFFTRITRVDNGLRCFLVCVGRSSMIFLGLNQLVIFLISRIYELIGLSNNIYIRGIIVLILSIVVLTGICHIVNRTKSRTLKIVLGN